MKEWRSQVRRFLHEAWWDWFRWLFLFCLASMGMATLVLWWRFGVYPFFVYLGCFMGCLVVSWVVMFLRRPQRRDFSGDR